MTVLVRLGLADSCLQPWCASSATTSSTSITTHATGLDGSHLLMYSLQSRVKVLGCILGRSDLLLQVQLSLFGWP